MGPVDREGVALGDLRNATYVSQEQGLDVDVDNLSRPHRGSERRSAHEADRPQPAPMGRAFRYQRRLAHIIVTVAEKKSGAGLATVVDDAPAAKSKPGQDGRKEDCR